MNKIASFTLSIEVPETPDDVVDYRNMVDDRNMDQVLSDLEEVITKHGYSLNNSYWDFELF